MSESSEAALASMALRDRDAEPFWRGLAEGVLRLQECHDCGVLRFPPRAICNRCFSFDAEWQAVSPIGVLVSWIRTHQVFLPAYTDRVPYVVVQVALVEQDDVLMIGGWRGDRDPVVGERVEASVVGQGKDTPRIEWRPIDPARVDREPAG